MSCFPYKFDECACCLEHDPLAALEQTRQYVVLADVKVVNEPFNGSAYKLVDARFVPLLAVSMITVGTGMNIIGNIAGSLPRKKR